MFLNYVWKSLKVDKAKSVLLGICVIFGVLSLVSMQLLTLAIDNTINSEPKIHLGGDLALSNFDSNNDLEKILEQAKAQGKIKDYTSYDDEYGLLAKFGKQGEFKYLGSFTTVNPDKYPLIGSFKFKDSTANLSSLLKDKYSGVITIDIAESNNLKVGDTVSILSMDRGSKVDIKITAIAEKTSDNKGNNLFVNLETAKAVKSNPDLKLNKASILKVNDSEISWPDGINVNTPEMVIESNKTVSGVFNLVFQGAGLLGLLVAGLGIANTLTVLMQHRLKEIAILKSVGLSRLNIFFILVTHTAIIGIIGSIIGIGIGALVAQELCRLLSTLGGFMLLTFTVTPTILLGGIAIGTLSTMLFSIHTIVKTANISPSVLFRSLEGKRSWKNKILGWGIVLLIIAIYILIGGYILKDLLMSVEVIGGGILALLVVGLLFKLIIKLILLIPTPFKGLNKLAKKNIKKSNNGAIFSMLAIFCGMVVIGFCATALYSGDMRVDNRMSHDYDYSILMNDQNIDETKLTDVMKTSNINDYIKINRIQTKIDGINSEFKYSGAVDSYMNANYNKLITGNSDNVEYALTKLSANEIYLPSYMQIDEMSGNMISKGANVTITDSENVKYNVVVKDFFDHKDVKTIYMSNSGPVVSEELFTKLKGESTSLVLVKVGDDKLAETKLSLNKTFPNSAVIGYDDMENVVNGMIKNMFVFIVAISSLALLAGVILIVNVVGLAVIMRRREIGIFKALGYSSRQVLRIFLYEYGFFGILSGIFSIGGVYALVEVVNQLEKNAKLEFNTPIALIMAVLAVVITLLTTYLVAIQTTKVRPMEVLRNDSE